MNYLMIFMAQTKALRVIPKDALKVAGLKIIPSVILMSDTITDVRLGDDGKDIHVKAFSGDNANFSGLGFDDKSCVIIASFLKTSTAMREVDLSHNHLGSDGAKVLVEVVNRHHLLENLNIRHNGNINMIESRLLAKAVEGNKVMKQFSGIPVKELRENSYNKSLPLSASGCGNPEALTLGILLEKNISLKILLLNDNPNIIDEAIRQMAECLKKNTSLETMNLSGKSIDLKGFRDDGKLVLSDHEFKSCDAIVITIMLKENERLENLDLRNNKDIDDKACKELSDAIIENEKIVNFSGILVRDLRNDNPTAKTLGLANTGCGNTEAFVLGILLEKNTTLTSLNLEKNHITFAGAKGLADGLVTNTTLKKLTMNGEIPLGKFRDEKEQAHDLSDYKYKDTEAIIIATLLKTNTTITELKLNDNEMTEEGITALAEGLHCNSVIKKLKLNGEIPLVNFRDKTTEELDLSNQGYKDSDAKIIAKFLEDNSTLTSLDMRKNSLIGTSGAKDLSSSLMKTKLRFFGKIPLSQFIQNEPKDEELDLSNSDIGDTEAIVIAACIKKNTTITSLDLRENFAIQKIGADALSKALMDTSTIQTFGEIPLRNLIATELDLSHKNIGDTEAIVISECIKGNTTLLDLNLNGNKITVVGANALSLGLLENKVIKKVNLNGEIPLKDLRDGATELDLSSKGYKLEDAIIISTFLKTNTKLLDLKLHGNEIDEKGAEKLSFGLELNTTLRKIKINGEIPIDKFRDGTKEVDLSLKGYNNVDAIIIATFLSSNSIMTNLDLSQNKIADGGAKQIAEKVKHNTTLTQLELSQNVITDEGVKVIAEALKKNHVIKILGLHLNEIQDEGAIAIGNALEVNKGLRMLWLDSNQISDKGMVGICKGLKKNCYLSVLNLQHNRIANEGASAFADVIKHNTTLGTMYLYCNEIGDDGAKAIAKELKDNSTLTTLHLYAQNKESMTEVGRNAIKDAKEKEEPDPSKRHEKRTIFHIYA